MPDDGTGGRITSPRRQLCARSGRRSEGWNAAPQPASTGCDRPFACGRLSEWAVMRREWAHHDWDRNTRARDFAPSPQAVFSGVAGLARSRSLLQRLAPARSRPLGAFSVDRAMPSACAPTFAELCVRDIHLAVTYSLSLPNLNCSDMRLKQPSALNTAGLDEALATKSLHPVPRRRFPKWLLANP